MGMMPSHGSATDYFKTPQRRRDESAADYAARLAAYDANYSRPVLIEPAVSKIKPRYRAKAWRAQEGKHP